MSDEEWTAERAIAELTGKSTGDEELTAEQAIAQLQAVKPAPKKKSKNLWESAGDAFNYAKEKFVDPLWAASQREVAEGAMGGDIWRDPKTGVPTPAVQGVVPRSERDRMISHASGLIMGVPKMAQDIYNTGAGMIGAQPIHDVDNWAKQNGMAPEAFRTGTDVFPNALPVGLPGELGLAGKMVEGGVIGAGQNMLVGPGQQYAATGKPASLQQVGEMAIDGAVMGAALGGAASLMHTVAASKLNQGNYKESEAFVAEQARLVDETLAKLQAIPMEGRKKIGQREQLPGLPPGDVQGRVVPPGEALTAPDDYTFKGRAPQEMPGLPPDVKQIQPMDLYNQLQQARESGDIGRADYIEAEMNRRNIESKQNSRLQGQSSPISEVIPLDENTDRWHWQELIARADAMEQMAQYGPEMMQRLEGGRIKGGGKASSKPQPSTSRQPTQSNVTPDQATLPAIPEKITLPESLERMSDTDVERIGNDLRYLNKLSDSDLARFTDEFAKRSTPAYKDAKLKADYDNRLAKRGMAEGRGVPTFAEDRHGTNAGRQTKLPTDDGSVHGYHSLPEEQGLHLDFKEYTKNLPDHEKWNPAELTHQELNERLERYAKKNADKLPHGFSNEGRKARFTAVENEIAYRKMAGVAEKGSTPATPSNTITFRDQLRKAVNIPDEHVDTVAHIVDRVVQATARKRGVTPQSLYEKFSVEKGSASGNKGVTDFYKDTGKAAMKLTDGADASTAFHEFAHVARRHLLEPDELRIVEKELAVRDGKWNESADEAYARMFEKYLHDGETPHAELKSVFERIKSWMRDIYKTLKGSDIDRYMSAEMKQHFDRLLGDENMPATRGESTAKERMREAILGGEEHRELADLRKEYLQLKPEVIDNRMTRHEQKKLMEKYGVEEVGTGESLRYESRLVDGEGNHIRDYEAVKIDDPKRFKEVKARRTELNKQIAGDLKPGERKTFKVGDNEYLVVSHDERKRLEGWGVKEYRKALKDQNIDAKTAGELHEAGVERLAQAYPRFMQGSVVNNAIALAKNPQLATKIKQFTGTMTGLDWMGSESPQLKDAVVGHLGELIRVGKGLKVDNHTDFAVAAAEALRMEPAEIMSHNGWQITPEQRRYLADSKHELMSMADTLKMAYDQNGSIMSDGVKRAVADMYEDITRGGNIETGAIDKNFEKSLLDTAINHVSGGLYDAVVTGNWHIHGLHVIDAALGAPATVGIRNATNAVISHIFNPDVRAFNKSFGHESGLKKVVKANDPTFWDKYVTATAERFINKSAPGRFALKTAKYLEGGQLENLKMDYLRAATLEQVARDMNMKVGDLAKALNNNTLTPLQSQTVYASLFNNLNDAVGYVPNGFRDKFGMERTAGKNLSKFVKLMQPFMGMRQVQSRLLTKLIVDGVAQGDPRQLAKAGTMIATIWQLGGAAAIAKPVAALISSLFGADKLNEFEELAQDTALGPKIPFWDRTVEHIKPDIAPWLFGSYEGLERLKKEGLEGAKTAEKLANGKMPNEHESRNAAKLFSYLAGGSNILGITSTWQLAQLKKKLDDAQPDPETGESGSKDLYSFLQDKPFQNEYAGKDSIHTDQIKELMNFFLGAGVDNEEHHVRSQIAQWKRVENEIALRYDDPAKEINGRKIAKQALSEAWEYLQEHPDEKVDWDAVYEKAEALAE